jgi:hypothetical protein
LLLVAEPLFAAPPAAAPGVQALPASAQTPPPSVPAPSSTAPAPVQRLQLPPVALREAPSLLERDPTGWTSVQPGPDLAGWTRLPWPATSTLGPQQWSVDTSTGQLVCDGRGGHEWLRWDREAGDAAFHVEWRFSAVEGADKYNSGVLARTATDLSAWHQAQVGLKGGFLFGLTRVHGVMSRVTQEPAALRVRPADEWNSYEIVARGRTLTLWVNGAVTSEIRVETPRGHFGLETEGWRIAFRNLMVKRLD